MNENEGVDWTDCALVEATPGVLGGASVLIGTRMPVDTIVDNFDYGVSVDEISKQFEVSKDQIEAILTYAKSHRIAHHI